MFYLFCAIGAFTILSTGASNFVRNQDICGQNNGRRLYLELGERGILYAKNVTFVKNAPRQQTSRAYVTNSSHNQCSLELVSCPSCIITVTFKHLELSHHCGDGSMMIDNPCRCDYVWIAEPPYEDVSGTPFCGLYTPLTYRSSTRTLSITLLYSKSHKHAFAMEYTAERNRLHLTGADIVTGVAKTLNNTGGGILTSPFFPARYPRDLGMEYIITCAAEAPSCRVRVLFSDFQLATVSIVEFYDWNGQRLDVSSGARFRPPVIVSSGPSLLIRFYANGGTGLGYKAFYSFVIGHLYDKSIQPITDCGGYVENLGGAITMMDMVNQGAKTYDCVWLIRPPKNFLHMKTHMYLKVVTFADMAGTTELTIKQGPTSALSPLEILRHPASQLQPPRLREHIAPVASGFHVSLRGTFGPTSRLAIAYSAFSYTGKNKLFTYIYMSTFFTSTSLLLLVRFLTDCFTGSDFLCQNHRCIPSQLNCDGFDHCGDDSDEPTTCFRNWGIEPQDGKWHVNKANYYFPKIDRYPDLKTATLVFVASSLGLIILISALIVLLYRMGARARQQRELQSRLQTISELLVFDITDGARIDEITVSDDPPVYEAPPGYDEVVKIGLESEGTRRKRKKSSYRQPRSRSTPNQHSNDLETQSTSLLVRDDASISNCSQTTPVLNEIRQSIPESPPPAYVTPPGTTLRNILIPITASPTFYNEEGEYVTSMEGSRARYSWINETSTNATSLPASEEPPADGPPSSLEAQTLGAYLQSYITGLTENSTLQQLSSQDASRDMNPEYEEKSEERGDVVNIEPENCACEGACGCAINECEGAREGEKLLDITSSIDEPQKDFSTTRNAIIKLLGSSNGTTSSERTNLNSTTVSKSSTPNSTLGRAAGLPGLRSPSICSKDSFITRISTLSSKYSSDEPHYEFDIVSEVTSIGAMTNLNTVANTPNCTPRITSPVSSRVGNHITCDMESLYESVKILDSFLLARGIPILQSRNHSTETLHHVGSEYGTCGNGASGESSNRNVTASRVWRSTDDTLIS
ncbi:uncharacterized protein LOC107219690 isoform X1 [Neodiprion lecontei]|uniref:Uncharacterized protein LOC107219690 isoform X1 n=1 Tax=Neodiprion lecontei TaxID=441921 RepID=A0ABM3FE40_NEOLC|nr:uncharacterized protein LOC107219690 isoform X1 [Neodiprion lecontei]